MTQLLIRLFIRRPNSPQDPRVRAAYGNLASVVGMVCNILLCLGKFVVGTLFGSIAITADALNNLSDASSNIVSLVGFKLAAKAPDAEHPYGHARFEYLAGLVVSVTILGIGFSLLKESVTKVLHPTPVQFGWLTVAVLVVSILVKLWMSRFNRTIGRTIGSETLIATAADSRSDVFSTLAVLLGLVISRLTGFNLDGYMGVAVALLILWTGVKVVKETSDPLLGTAPAREVVDDIYRTILSYDGILGLHDLNVHMYGEGRTFASVHCEVDAHEDILASHDLVDNIERDFLKQKNIHLVIHMDPIVVDDAPTNALREQVREVLRGISPEITMHDFRVVWGKTHSNVLFDVCVPFGFRYTDAALLDEIANGIYMLGKNYVPVVTVDHSYVPEHRQDS